MRMERNSSDLTSGSQCRECLEDWYALPEQSLSGRPYFSALCKVEHVRPWNVQLPRTTHGLQPATVVCVYVCREHGAANILSSHDQYCHPDRDV
jgi:hypothetical protein